MTKLNVAASITPEQKPLEVKETSTNKDRLQKLISEETKTVKGRFRNYDNPGSAARIQVRKYPGIQMFDKWMFDEGTYEIPLYVARHLNGVDVVATALNGKTHTCSYPVHGFKSNDGNFPIGEESYCQDGPTVVPKQSVVKRVRRYGFESMEFNIE